MTATLNPIDDIHVQAGCVVRPDEWRLANLLIPSDWDRADFRLRSSQYDGITYACNVKVTGRTLQYREGGWWVRVRITFVGDGEPDQVCGGWLAVNYSGGAIVNPDGIGR